MDTGYLNVLIVEDNEDDFVIVRDLLRDINTHRYALEWVKTYEDGVEAIRAQRHDLILMDFRLSHQTGLELLAETQSVSLRAPVILMTGQGDYDIDVQAMQAGATDYLVKDRLDADVLERAIRYAVERQKSAEALRASEDRYRTFVENSSEGIWRFELEEPMPTNYSEEEQITHLARYAYVAECNEAMAHIYGFAHSSDILGARFGQFLSAADSIDDNYLRQLIHNQYRLVNTEAFGYDRDGHPKYILHNLIGVVENGFLSRIWGSQTDITERKQSENVQAQLAAIVEFSADAIYSKTLDGLILTWNKAAEALYGYTMQEVIGQHISRFKLYDRPEEITFIQGRIKRGERVPEFETIHRHRDGQAIDVSLAVSPIIYADNEIIGSSTIVRNITDRRRAEAALSLTHMELAESEARFRTSVDAMEEGLVLHDASGAILFCNRRAGQILSLSADQIIGRTSLDPLWQTVREDGTDFPGEQHPALIALREGVPQKDVTMGVYTPHGPLIWININAVLLEPAPQKMGGQQETPHGVVVTFSDVTRQRQAETVLKESQHRLTLATESAQIGIWEWDVVADKMLWDAQMYALYGIREQDFSGAYDAWQRGLHPEDRAKAEAEIAAALDGSQDFRTHFRVIWPGGEIRHIEAHALVLRADDGTPQRMIGVNWDITERKLAEDERDLVNHALRASEQRLRLMLESGQFGTFHLDLIAGHYSAISDVGRRQFAFPPKGDIFARDFFQRVHPDDLAELQATLVRVAAVQGGDLQSDYRIILPDGSVRWISVHCTIGYNDAGLPNSMLGVTQDITHRVEAQRALQASEQRFRSVVETVESLVIHDQEGHLIDVNKNAWDSLGYTREEMLQLRVQDYELNYEQKGVAQLWKQLSTGEKKTAVLEGVHRRRDGTTFPVEVRIGLMTNDGTLLMVAVARDITDRKQAQEALLNAEREQRQLAAHLEVERARLADAQTIAKVGSWDLDLRTDVLTWSDETHHIFGSNPAEFQNSYQDFLRCVHPDDREDLHRLFMESIADRTPCEAHHRVLKQDGSVAFLHERWQTFHNEDGQPLRSIGTTQDVTESHLMVDALRRSEHEFRRIVETTHEGVVQVDADLKITYVNQRYCDMLGYTPQELLGRPATDQMDDEIRVQAQERFEHRRQGVTEQFDRRLRHKDGSEVWVIVSVSPLIDEDGRMIGSLSMTTDITERKRLEAQVHRSEKLASLGEMVAGVAHEINNPMAAILGNAELLEMNPDPQVREDAQTIQRMSQRVTRIVRSLLTFARAKEGERREESLNVVVEHALEMSAYKLRKADVVLEMHLQEPSPMIQADASEIQQVLINLIFNAEHAVRGNAGEKRIIITTARKQIDHQEWATVAVADNGHGIPQEIRERIFDPFFTTKGIGEGTGLGLSICHGIADSHGGRMSVESELEHGTTFTLELPSVAHTVLPCE